MSQEYDFNDDEIQNICPFPINLYFKLRMFISADNVDKTQWSQEQKQIHKNMKKDILRMLRSNQDFNLIDDLNKTFIINPKN